VRKAFKVYRLGGAISEILYSPAAFGLDMSVKNMPKPRGRISAQVRPWLQRAQQLAAGRHAAAACRRRLGGPGRERRGGRAAAAQVAVLGNTLFLMGGIVEVGEREITLDDMWALDLAKLDGWQQLRENSAGEELFVEDKPGKESSDEWETDGDE
jgi:hypothetical protein